MAIEFDGIEFPTAEARTHYIGMNKADRQKWRDAHAPMKPPLPTNINIEQPAPEGGVSIVPQSEIFVPPLPRKPHPAPPQADTAAAIGFLKAWPTYPTLSASWVDGEGNKVRFETQAFPPPVDWGAVTSWIDARQGKANLYFAVNPSLTAVNKKADLANIASVVAFHLDVDVRIDEEQQGGIQRIINTFGEYKTPPSIIVSSGGGAQAFWFLKHPVPINGDLAKAEDVKHYNIQIERDLAGDNCHDISRIMRLPGTINIPDIKKLKKGRKPAVARVTLFEPARKYDLDEFVKAKALTEKDKTIPFATGGSTFKASDSYADIAPNDPRLAALEPKWLTLGRDGDVDGKYNVPGRHRRSGALFAFCVACVRAGIADDVIAAILTDPAWRISEPILEKHGQARKREVERSIARAHDAAVDEDLAEMNEAHCVLPIGGRTRVMAVRPSLIFPGQTEASFSSFEDFANLHSNRRKTFDTDQGPKEIPLGRWWLNHKRRRQYNGGRQFMPHIDEPVMGETLNMWTGFTTSPARTGSWDRFRKHIFWNVCNGHLENFKYLIRLLAFIVQRRTRSGICVLLRSLEEGSGKGFTVKHFGYLFGPHYMQVGKPEHVIAKHNDHLEHLLVLCADEALFAGDPRHRNALYNLITEPTLTIEPKFVGAYPAPNHINVFITTNAQHAIPVGHTARRFFAQNVAPHEVGNPDFFDAIEDQLRAGGYQRMLYDLQRVDLTGFDVRKVPKTAALAEQAALSRSGIDALIENVAHTAWLPFQHHLQPNVASTKGAKHDDGFWSWIRNNFPDLKHKTPHALARALAPWGCDTWNSGGPHIRFPADVRALRKVFDAKHGAQDWSKDPEEWVKEVPQQPQQPAAGDARPRTRDVADDEIPF